MKRCLGLFLLLCVGMLHMGSGLRCYQCSGSSAQCQNVQECTSEDSCISVTAPGGNTIRQCIKYSDCDFSQLSNFFPSLGKFTFKCCSTNLCNAGNTVTMTTPILALVASLLSVWWCWS